MNNEIAVLKARIDNLESSLRMAIDDVVAAVPQMRPDITEGRFVDQYAPFTPTPDTDSPSATAPVRKSIEYNPAEDTHEYELQLRNVDTIPASSEKIPLFTTDSEGSGDLTWVDMPSPDDLTVEINATTDDDIEGKIQLFGADEVVASSVSIPIMRGPNVGIAPESLEWVEIDGEMPSPAGSSLKLTADTPPKLEINGFGARAELDPIGSTDLVMINVDSADPRPGYATKAAMKDWLSSDGDALPWMCGYTISGTGVTLTAGLVFWGTGAPFSVASSNVTISGSICYGLEVTMSGATWVSKTNPEDFVDTEDTLRQFYYQFNVAAGKAYLVSIGAQGNWKIPGVFAKG